MIAVQCILQTLATATHITALRSRRDYPAPRQPRLAAGRKPSLLEEPRTRHMGHTGIDETISHPSAILQVENSTCACAYRMLLRRTGYGGIRWPSRRR